MDDIRAYLRGVREERGLSRAEMAKRCGVTEGTVGQFEAKGGSYSASLLWRVCAELGVQLVPEKVRQ